MEKLCKQATNMFIEEIKKEEVQCKIQDDILNPVVKYVGERLYPYILGATLLLSFFTLVLMYTSYLIFKINHQGHQ
jgi:hypothetical protein